MRQTEKKTYSEMARLRVLAVEHLAAGMVQSEVATKLDISPATISVWARKARGAALSPSAALRRAGVQRRLRLLHPALMGIREATPSLALFERVLTEVPDLVRRACLEQTMQTDPLWPLARWMMRHVRKQLVREIVGALYGLSRERIRQIEEVALAIVGPELEQFRGRTLDVAQLAERAA